MSYDVGQQIDLSYINKKKPEVAPRASKKSEETLYEIGVSFILREINGQIQAARRIPVAFA